MQKKILGSLALALLLTGCSSNNHSDNKSTSSKSNSSKIISSKTSPKDKKSGDKNTENKSEKNRFENNFELNNEFLKTEIKPFYLPSQEFNSTTKNLNLHADVTNQTKRIIYSISEQQKKPDKNLTLMNGESLFVKYEEQSLTNDEIKNQINWIPEQQGLPTINLGFNIKATTEGAAGSTYLTWHEGKWSLTIRSSNLTAGNNDKAVELAKKMVAYFEQNALPAPETVGSILVNYESTDDEKIQIKWDHQDTLISINGSDVFNVLNYATKLK